MHRLRGTFLLLMLSVMLVVPLVIMPPTFAQSDTPQAILERFLTSDEVQADWFADDFLAQVPLAQIEELRQQITAQLGAYQRIEGTTSPFTVVMAGGNLTAAITLDDTGKIAGLRLNPAQPPPEPSDPTPTITPQAALERLFTSDTIEEAWFGEAFLAQVSPNQVAMIITQVTDQVGEFVAVEGEASPFTVRFANGRMTAEISLDADGRIVGLFFQPPMPAVDSLEEAVAHFEALPGDVSVLVWRDGEALADLNAAEPLAVGSAFKLAILAALQDQINAGEHTWDEVVTLDPSWKSLPSGMLQDWPEDSPLTLHTLATLMISLSDNTATDALLNIVGRDAVEEYTARNQPFLTTQEAFKLKATPNADLLTRYRAGDEAEKRQVLADLADVPLPAPADFPTEPTLAVEWYFTAYELCDLMAQVQTLELMTVNPGPGITDPAAWARIAYKGGSELGVLNLTYWLEREDSTATCVVVTQNRSDTAIDETNFFGLTRALIGTLTSTTSTTSTPPSADLTDPQWQLLSFGPTGDETAVVAGSMISLTFSVDGQAGGFSGCNVYGGAYQVADDRLTFDTIVSTQRACADEAVMQQEQQYLQALQQAERFTLTEERLTIVYEDEQADDGQGALTFAPGAIAPLQARTQGCYYPGQSEVWLLAQGEVQQVELPITVGLYFDCTAVTGRLLYGSHFPDQGAGPGQVSVTDLWLLDLATEAAEPLFDEDVVVEALWASGGESFAYIRATDASYELRWRSLAGEDRLLATDVAFTFSVSPSGEQVAFTRESGYGLDVQPGLYMVDVATGVEMRIADVDRAGTGGIDDRPTWSPTGDYVILPLTGLGAGNGLVRAAIDGSGATALTFDSALADEAWYEFLPTNLIWAESTQLIGMAFIAGPDIPLGGEPYVIHYQLNDNLDTIIDGAVIVAGVLIGWDVPGESVWVLIDEQVQSVALPAEAE